jgi:hypothetical protein
VLPAFTIIAADELAPTLPISGAQRRIGIITHVARAVGADHAHLEERGAGGDGSASARADDDRGSVDDALNAGKPSPTVASSISLIGTISAEPTSGPTRLGDDGNAVLTTPALCPNSRMIGNEQESDMTNGAVASSGGTWLGFFRGIAAVGMLANVCLVGAAWAQNGAPQASVGHMAPATLRTVADMEALNAALSNLPNLPLVMPPSLPTMDLGQYLALKAAAAVDTGAKSGVSAPAPASPQGPPALGGLHCNAIGQLAPIAQGFSPPDTHGAIGANHYGQVVNSAIRFYSRALTGNCPTSIVINVKLSSFFGYTNQALFDPRIVYDLTYNRWIVSAEASPESSSVQYHFIAVSVDSDPNNGFFFYSFNMAGIVGNGVFWDYPQIGYDEDAIILTGNKFSGNTYLGSTPVFLPKHRMYAGLSFSFCFFNGGSLNVGTIAPPIVLDQGPYTALAVASPGANFIRVHKVLGTSHVCPTFLSTDDIATTTNVPPLAQQPTFANCLTDPAHCLDTLDGRFQNASTQSGTPSFGSPVRLWQARTDSIGSFPTPYTYRINADTLAIEENCSIITSFTSHDFNPAIVANGVGTLFVTWSSTDPTNNLNAQVRIGGKKFGDACSVLGAGSLVNQSGNPLTGNFDPDKGFQRWGDYSAVTLDPLDFTTVWGVNEKIQALIPPNTDTTWKSYIFNMSNP